MLFLGRPPTARNNLDSVTISDRLETNSYLVPKSPPLLFLLPSYSSRSSIPSFISLRPCLLLPDTQGSTLGGRIRVLGRPSDNGKGDGTNSTRLGYVHEHTHKHMTSRPLLVSR